jgi:hypothetical protein
LEPVSHESQVPVGVGLGVKLRGRVFLCARPQVPSLALQE